MSAHINTIVAERTLSLTKERISARLEECGYCDNGVNAYEQVEEAIRRALEDVRAAIQRANLAARKVEGGL